MLDAAVVVAILSLVGVIIKLLVDRSNSVRDAKLKQDADEKDFKVRQADTVSKSVSAASELFSALCKQYSDRIDQLHRDMGKAEGRITALENDNAQLRKDNEELKNQICDLQDALKDSVAERERLQKEVDNLSERLKKYEAKPSRPGAAK